MNDLFSELYLLLFCIIDGLYAGHEPVFILFLLTEKNA